MKLTKSNETSDMSCGGINWIEHWEKFSGEELPEICQEKSCSNKPEVGALVRKNSATDRSLYVLPLCAFHNDQKGEKLKVKNSVNLVSANEGANALNTQAEERFWTFQNHIKAN